MRRNIKFALPMPAFKSKEWDKIGKRIFNGKEQNEPKRTNRNHKQNIK